MIEIENHRPYNKKKLKTMFTENQDKGGEGTEDTKRVKIPEITPKIPKAS